MATTNRAMDTVPSNSLQPSVPINADLVILDAAIYGLSTIEFATDANRTLTTTECDCSFLHITDSTALLTAGRDVVFPARFPMMLVQNDTAQTLTLKKSGQAGVTLEAGGEAIVASGASDVLKVEGGSGGAVAASAVSITDAGGYFTGTDVEAALQELGAGGGGGGGGSSAVTTISGTTYTVTAADDGAYLRFTNTSAKTVTIDPDATTALPANGEWFIRNHGTNNLTISPGVGVTVNLPSGGSLVIASGGSALLKRVATDTFDLL